MWCAPSGSRRSVSAAARCRTAHERLAAHVGPGWRVTIYKDTGYRDHSLSATEDVANFQLVRGDCDKGGLNDCVSSLRVRPE